MATGSARVRRFNDWITQRVHALGSSDAELLLRVTQEYFGLVRAQIVVIVAMILIISATTAGVALMVEDVVNVVFEQQNTSMFIYLMIAAMLLFALKGVATYYQSAVSARVSNKIVAEVQSRLFRHVLSQQMSMFAKYSTDELMMRFNHGANGFGSILTTVLISGVRDAAQVVALVGVMVYQDPIISLVCVVLGPIVYYGVVRLLAKIRGLMEAELAGYSEFYRRVREASQGITVIKSFNLEPAAYARATDVIQGLRSRMDRIAALQAAPLPLLEVVGGLGVGLAILYAGIRGQYGEYDPGTFMSFLTALLLAADPARRLSQMRVSLRTSFVAIQMVYKLLDDNHPESDGPEQLKKFRNTGPAGRAKPPSIEFEDVSFSYAHESPVLRKLDLKVDPGEMVALVGPSGAGKSTVFKLLLKFYRPTSGTIRIGGIDLADVDTRALRHVIAYVGQANFMFGGSIRDNLSLMDPDIPLETIAEACRTVDLHDHITSLPKGYDTDVGELGSHISGGQAQRINLARAMIKNSPVLLLDEVTSALDAENEQKVKQVVRKMARGKTILVIAHRLSTIRDADRIALVRDGRIVDCGRHEDLIKSNHYYEKIVSLQFA